VSLDLRASSPRIIGAVWLLCFVMPPTRWPTTITIL
jgi:hypothetical protein